VSGRPDNEWLELLDGMRLRFALIDRQLQGLQGDIVEYTSQAVTAPAPQPVPPPQPAPAQQQQQAAPRPAAPQPQVQRAAPPPPPEIRVPPRRIETPTYEPSWVERKLSGAGAAIKRYRGELTLSDFLGLRALAWAGGVITLLGIAFFYVLANERGWVGPGSRVLLGTSISAGLLALGWWLRQLRGQPEAALAAAGTGIAGLYVTLYAATKLYGYVPTAGGLPLALAIAGLAVVIALAWSAESLALLGLTGAALAPPLVQAGITPAGVGFAVIVAAAAMVLYTARDWKVVAAAGSATTVPQLAWLVSAQSGAAPALGWNPHYQTVVLAGAFWAVYVGSGFARYLRRGSLDQITATLFASTATSAILAAALLFDGRQRGWAMLGVAGIYAGLAWVPRLAGRPNRDLSSLFGATALTAVLVATVELLGGGTRAVAVAGEAGLMAWLSARLHEQRYQVASFAYLCVALGLTLIQAPPINLVAFPPIRIVDAYGNLDTALMLQSMASVIAFAGAVALFAVFSRPMADISARTWRRTVGGTALGAALYAASTVILEGFMWLHFTERSFQNGHTAVSLVVALVGVGLLLVGLRRHSTDLRTTGLILLGAAVAKLFLFDLEVLNLMARAMAFILVGLLLLAGGIVYQRLWDDDMRDSRRQSANAM
jgi:uncharacterized membrane protein